MKPISLSRWGAFRDLSLCLIALRDISVDGYVIEAEAGAKLIAPPCGLAP